MDVKLDKMLLKELSRKSLWPWTAHALMDWVVIGAASMFFLLVPHVLTFFIALLVIGNRQHALVILGHDGTHFTLSRNKPLNDFLTNLLCFWPLGLTVSGYRALHYKHHKHTGTSDDPELVHKKSRAPQWDLPAKPVKILKYALLDMMGMSLPDYWIIISYSKPEFRKQYLPLLFWHICFIALFVMAGLWMILLLWYASLISTFMMYFRLRLWLEHQGTSDTHRLSLNFLEGAILAPHNSWMHWEHHNWPSVPYHHLPRLRILTPGVEVIKLSDLIKFYETASEMNSGEVVSHSIDRTGKLEVIF